MSLLHQSKLLLKFGSVLFLLTFFIAASLSAQSTISNKYDLFVVNDLKTLEQQIKENPFKQMIDIGTIKDLRRLKK